MELYDQSRQHYRGIQLKDNQLLNCFFINSEKRLPPRDWLISLFDKTEISRDERMSLLKASFSSAANTGKTVCSCFNVGETQIIELIKGGKVKTVDDIGEQCKAGSNCGSCKPELSELLAQY